MAAPSIHEIILNVAAESEDAKTDLAELGAELLALDAADAEAELHLEDAQFKRELRAAKADLAALSKFKSTPEVDAATAAAKARVDELEAKLAVLAAKRYEVTIDVDKSALDRVENAGSSGGGGSSSGGIMGMLSNMGGRVQLLLRLLPTLIPMVVQLGGVIVGLASYAVEAAAGLGALAVAAGAAATPVAALAAAAISRFTGASAAALKLRTANEAVRSSLQGVNDAERAVSDAERSQRFATQALVQARHDAAQQLRDDMRTALQGQADAEHGVEDALRSQQSAQQALNDARQQAVRDLQDMRAAATNAALGEKAAELALERARNKARQFDAGDHSLAAREARLEVKRAEEQLAEARRTGKRSADDLNEAEQKGVHGSDAVVAARQSLADANYAVAQSNTQLADANRQLARVQAQAQKPADAVVAARRSLADANRGVEDSERSLARATDALRLAQQKQAAAQRTAAQSTLGPAGHQLKQAGREFMREFRASTDAGVNQIYKGIAKGLGRLKPLLRGLRGNFTRLGGAIGGVFASWGKELSSPKWVDFWKRTTNAATRIIPDLGDGVRFLARAFRDVADAAMPFLEDAAGGFRDWAKGLSESTGHANKTESAVGTVIDALSTLKDLAVEVGKALFNIGKGAAPSTGKFVEDMVGSLRKWNKWASSKEGQARIKEFFDKVVPAGEKLLGLVGKLGKAFLAWGELASPAMGPLYDILGRVLDLLNGLLGILDDLPGPLGDLASGLAAFAGLKLIFGGSGGLLSSIGGLFSKLGSKEGGGLIGRLGGLSGALRAVPYAAAAYAAVEYGDDLGKAAASIMGYSDEVIRAQRNLGHAQDTLSSRLGDMAQLERRLNRTGKVAVENRDDLYSMFSPKELDKAIAITKRGGDLLGHTFVQNAIDKLNESHDTFRSFFVGLGHSIVGWIESLSDKFKRAGVSIMDSIAQGIKSQAPGLGGLLQAGVDELGNALGVGGHGQHHDHGQGHGKIGDAAAAAGKAAVDGFTAALKSAAADVEKNAKADVAVPMVEHAAKTGSTQSTSHNTFNMPLTVVGGGSPDPVATVAAVSRALRRRGLSLA